MKVIPPSHEILFMPDPDTVLKNIELAGRTCYKSEDKISDDSAQKFVGMILKSGHHSVIEHANISVRFVCDRGVTHELVRHRLAAYSQESTRYANYSKDKFGSEITVIKPFFLGGGYPGIPSLARGHAGCGSLVHETGGIGRQAGTSQGRITQQPEDPKSS